MSALLEFLLSLSILAFFVVLALVLIGVALAVYLLVRHGFFALRARKRHARYVPAGYRKRGTLPPVNRTDLIRHS